MSRTMIALALFSMSAAVGAEPAKFGQEHISPALACSVVGYRYTGAAKLVALGIPKEEIARALLAYQNSGETEEDIRIGAEQAAEYGMAHSKAETELMAEEKFAACLKEKNLPVNLELAPKCWRGVQRVDDIIEQRKAGVSKETLLERAAAVEAKNEAQGKAMRVIVEKVYAWDKNPAQLSFVELLRCVRLR